MQHSCVWIFSNQLFSVINVTTMCFFIVVSLSASESSTDYSDHASRQTLIKEKTLFFIAGILMALSVVYGKEIRSLVS